MPKFLNDDLSRGFTIAHVAEKHGWTDPMVWSLMISIIPAAQCRLFLSSNKSVSHKGERSNKMVWQLLYSMSVEMSEENKS